ncbi:acetyl-CoA carboxylase biotin carboxyl carrier protein [Haematobacter genomosp. 1]|uniref:Biotin carboxyl carrier protein of acetyl-CoA carboxylase n=1 Tax=Haematobacter genomosp. 1 TaxID=366618 RepID=A0A212AEE7_9RHOB|nr:biotin/lipoyl-containing protein [Haematobacter genomosp. 1]OWJ79694.1 acetyl-CoA carboxylase biotin carboxyl carrier protein subunit [Haematobacter genomosp. 1]
MDIDHIKSLIQAAHDAGLSELTVREAGLTIHIQRGTASLGASVEAAPVETGTPPAPSNGIPGHTVEAPMPGAFFRAGTPGDPPFVEIGATVEAGQTLAVIEAMKMLTPVKAAARGIVTTIHAGNGDTVEIGQPLFTLEDIG